MPVVEAADGMPVEANRVYAIPSGKYAALDRDRLKLSAAVAQ